MYEKFFYTIVRGLMTYFFIMFFSRLMGRKLISQMTFFDFVVGITLGSLSANMAMGADNSAITAATGIGTLSVLAILTGYLSLKSFNLRKLVNSEPVTVVDKGEIVEKNLKKIRLPIDGLNMKLREKNIFNLADVEFAIMEIDGQLSVLPKGGKKSVTVGDLNLNATTGLTIDLIIDGNLMKENLSATGLDSRWINTKLKEQGINKISDVIYAGLDINKNLYISKKQSADDKEKSGMYGIE